LEETLCAQESIERLIADAGEENTTKITKTKGPPTGNLMVSTTCEAQHRTKHEQSSVPCAAIFLQDSAEGRTGIAFKGNGGFQPRFKRVSEKRKIHGNTLGFCGDNLAQWPLCRFSSLRSQRIISAEVMPEPVDPKHQNHQRPGRSLVAVSPVVEKETVPVKRVRLDKETVTEERTATEEVRKENIELDEDGRSNR
jgi:hypothetical protein